MLRNNNNYLIACIWFMIHIIISSTNDILTQILCADIPFAQALSLRFLSSFIVLIPFWYIKRGEINIMKSKWLHISRGLILCIGLFFFSKGLSKVHISVATTINFSIPFFVLILARLILKEKISKLKFIATILGFLGIILILRPDSEVDPDSWFLIISTLCFASLDIINKKFLVEESVLSMIIGSSLMSTIFIIPVAIYNWAPISYQNIIFSFVIGAGGNLLLFCILKSFQLANVSSLTPLRYSELVISSFLSYIIFNNLPSLNTIIGAIIIIASNLYIVYNEL